MEYQNYNGTTTMTIQPIPKKSSWVCWNQRSQPPFPTSNPNPNSNLNPTRIPKPPTRTKTHHPSTTTLSKLSKLFLAITIFLGATYGEGLTRTFALIVLFVVYLTEVG